ncbi:MAG: hypothetical protein A2X68_04725 [Ignavibacteria bacterium GWC2_56_12]|nr:MAG: hypothetical protein A2X68_04725 [Ignavibacteria bacterium GWC2_56_12]
MTLRIHRLLLQLFAVLAVPVIIGAQPRGGELEQSVPIGLIQYSIFQLPGPAADSIIVDLHYRLQQQYFVFLRQANGRFEAKGELLAEFLDDNGTSVGREIRPIRVERSELPGPNEILPDIQSIIRNTLPMRRVNVVFEVKSFESGRTFLERMRRVSMAFPLAGPALLDDPMPAYRDSGTHMLKSFNRNGAILYGSTGGLVLSARLPENSHTAVIRWKVHSQGSEFGSVRREYEGTDTLAADSHVELAQSEGEVGYRLTPGLQNGWCGFFLSLPLHLLEPGTPQVDLILESGGTSVERTYRLPVVWPSRPQSLSRFDLAVDALRHIATEEDIDDMTGFMADGGQERVREYWRKRDPDTTTAYNEVQEEYYRRVDEAIRKFSTRGEFDGYKTDRGRILILWGTPSSMNRVFRPNTGPREIWTYESLRKRFIFSDPSRTGEYVLTQTEDL